MWSQPLTSSHGQGRRSLGSGGSGGGPVTRTEGSRIPLPALKTSYYMGVRVLFFFFALDFDPKLLTNIGCWDFVMDKLVQLIYAGGVVFNILRFRVEVV